MKKSLFLLLIAIILILSGCKHNPTVTHSAISSNAEQNKNKTNISLNDSDEFIQYKNNIRYTDSGTYYSFAYVSDDETYITLPEENKNGIEYVLYKIESNDAKEKIANNARGAFQHNNILYYINWGGDTHSSYSIIARENNNETVLVDNIDDAFFGSKGIYYTKDFELFLINYDKSNAQLVYKPTEENKYFDAYFYNNRLWIQTDSTFYQGDEYGQNLKTVDLDSDANIITFRNNYIYYFYYDEKGICNVGRYDIQKNFAEVLPNKFGLEPDINVIGFTDNYCIFSVGNDLFRIDSSFEKSERIWFANGTITWVAVSNNEIFLRVLNSDESKEVTIHISENGEIIENL